MKNQLLSLDKNNLEKEINSKQKFMETFDDFDDFDHDDID